MATVTEVTSLLMQQLDRLDAIRAATTLEDYVQAWIDASDEFGAAAYVYWRKWAETHQPVYVLSFDTSCLTGERRFSLEALHDHADGIDGFREALIDRLIELGRFIDNRVSL